VRRRNVAIIPISGRLLWRKSVRNFAETSVFASFVDRSTGGVGPKFSDMFAGSAAITWDRGTSTGIGTQTDTWTFGAGAAYTPNENVEVRLGGALRVLTSGSSGTVTNAQGTFGNEVSYSFGNDLVAAVSLGAKIKF
jgi:long-chain fatty acid transport protein